MIKLICVLFVFVGLTGCARYALVEVSNSISQIEKDMQDYACSKHRGVKKYTEAEYVECNVRNVWMKWESEK
jgi:outer membrane lipoprotein-sorting protein